MFNETLLFKVLLPCAVWLCEQRRRKIFWLCCLGRKLLVFVLHRRIRLKTSRLSYGFAFGGFCDASDGCSLFPPSASECTRGSCSVFLPPSKTTSATLVSRSWRC